MTTTENEAAREPPSPLWNRQRRSCTTGMLLIVTLAAFEVMGRATVLRR